MDSYAFVASRAIKNAASRLQSGFFLLIYAGCANIVRRLAVIHFRLQHISKCSSSECMKFITLYLTFPIFELSQFFFKLGYFAGERHLFFKTGESNDMSIHKLCVDLGNCGDKLVVIGKTIRSFDYFKRCFNAGNNGRKFGKHGNS